MSTTPAPLAPSSATAWPSSMSATHGAGARGQRRSCRPLRRRPLRLASVPTSGLRQSPPVAHRRLRPRRRFPGPDKRRARLRPAPTSSRGSRAERPPARSRAPNSRNRLPGRERELDDDLEIRVAEASDCRPPATIIETLSGTAVLTAGLAPSAFSQAGCATGSSAPPCCSPSSARSGTVVLWYRLRECRQVSASRHAC
jgi:hypothetical protein